jgi:hypothetical protein
VWIPSNKAMSINTLPFASLSPHGRQTAADQYDIPSTDPTIWIEIRGKQVNDQCGDFGEISNAWQRFPTTGVAVRASLQLGGIDPSEESLAGRRRHAGPVDDANAKHGQDGDLDGLEGLEGWHITLHPCDSSQIR